MNVLNKLDFNKRPTTAFSTSPQKRAIEAECFVKEWAENCGMTVETTKVNQPGHDLIINGKKIQVKQRTAATGKKWKLDNLRHELFAAGEVDAFVVIETDENYTAIRALKATADDVFGSSKIHFNIHNHRGEMTQQNFEKLITGASE